ncbi:hypothetical protein KUTeg_019378 [Tegillarca granosa]|uniref:Uncharacterized protein n=1 Tax=Tegillarca granosa TaxID=220873 RepID=A0ABQ9EHC5_TEGGR|nr:hypothetical protein KUTeg_019378 [Tegillarca granosa]
MVVILKVQVVYKVLAEVLVLHLDLESGLVGTGDGFGLGLGVIPGARVIPGAGVCPGFGASVCPGSGVCPGLGCGIAIIPRTGPDDGVGCGVTFGFGCCVTTPGAGVCPGAGVFPGTGVLGWKGAGVTIGFFSSFFYFNLRLGAGVGAGVAFGLGVTPGFGAVIFISTYSLVVVLVLVVDLVPVLSGFGFRVLPVPGVGLSGGLVTPGCGAGVLTRFGYGPGVGLQTDLLQHTSFKSASNLQLLGNEIVNDQKVYYVHKMIKKGFQNAVLCFWLGGLFLEVLSTSTSNHFLLKISSALIKLHRIKETLLYIKYLRLGADVGCGDGCNPGAYVKPGPGVGFGAGVGAFVTEPPLMTPGLGVGRLTYPE